MDTKTREVSNSDDMIDSRDVIARIEELETELAAEHDDDEQNDVLDMRAELETLKALAEQGEGCADWKYGATLVRDSYFRDYAQELADDIGAINSNASWPNNCIDWERAARELRMDYSAIDFDGVTYLVKS